MTGRLAATVQVHGGWLDWKTRRLTVPSAELLQAFMDLRDSAALAELPPISTQRTVSTAAPA